MDDVQLSRMDSHAYLSASKAERMDMHELDHIHYSKELECASKQLQIEYTSAIPAGCAPMQA
jgi:hypothetical protein